MTTSDRVKAPSGARPSVEDVAILIRARTKDSHGAEAGTFDEDTRPTGDQVEELIDAALATVLMRLPDIELLQPELVPAIASVVALDAACRVEKSYFPEQIRTNRSAYPELLAEYMDARDWLVEAAVGGPGGLKAVGFSQLPVGSWTSIRQSWPWGEGPPP